MRKEIVILLAAIGLMLNLTVDAQKREGHEERMEKYRAEKVSFLTTQLDFTPDEAEKFWPIYNQMEKERWEAQKLRRELEHKVKDAEENLSDKEVIKLTREYSSSMQKEGELLVGYNEKLLKVLSPKKVLKLYKTENEFRMYMIKKYRDSRGKGKGNEHP